MGTNKRNRFDVSPYLFISPVFILLALLVVYPIAYAFYLSVMDTNLTTKWEFVGLSNYISLLKDGSMINSLKVTFLFTIVVVLGHLAVGTILALAMNKKKPGVTVLICPLSSRQVKYLKVSDKNTYISFWSVGIFMHTISLYIF